MKKLFTLMAAALFAVGASAQDGKISLNLSEATTGWGENSINAETGEVTIVDNGAYGWWTSGPGDATYTKLVLHMENVQKSSWFQLTLSDSDNFPLDEGSYVKVIDISSVSTINRVMFQGGAGSKYTIKEAYFATDAYITANDVKDEKIFGDTQELSLASLGSGWESEYNADTKTITITGEDGGGKGWWVKPADYSHFDNFVVEFDPATTVGGQVVVQYVEDSDNADAVAFYKGATCVVVQLDATRKSAVQQMYIQGAKDATFTLKSAFVAIASATPEANLGVDEGGDDAPATLIDYPTKKDGITVSGTCEFSSVKIHNADAIDGIKFNNSYTADGALNANYVTLEVDGGFKKGDKIEIAGAFNNSSNDKKAAVDLFSLDGTTPTVLFTTAQFINGKTVDADPISETYTLAADAEKLYLGRNGNTATFVTLLKIVRETATGIQEIPVKVVYNDAIYNLAGQKVNETYKGIVIKNGKKYIQK